MKYSLTTYDQINHFLFAVGFGFLAGILYRLIACVREAVSNKKTAFIVQDIFFSVIITVLCFTFMLVYSNGEVRLDLLFAILLGAGVYFLTLDTIFKSAAKTAAQTVKKILLLVFKPFVIIFNALKKALMKLKSRFSGLKKPTKRVKKKKAEPETTDKKEKKSKKFRRIRKHKN